MVARTMVVMEVVTKPAPPVVPASVAPATPPSVPVIVFVGVLLPVPVARTVPRFPGRGGSGGHATAPSLTRAAPLAAA